MPSDFDFEDQDVEDTLMDVSAEVASPTRAEHSSLEFDNQMSEVEKRLEMAQYYRLVLNDTIFNDPPNVEVADRVEGEIRDFVRSRMALLVGVGSVKEQTSSFSAEEEVALKTLAQPEVLQALKALAAKILKKPEILTVKPKPAEKPKEVREPSLKKIHRTQPAKQAAQQEARPRAPAQKQVEAVSELTGRKYKKDTSTQARPVGITPFPTPTTASAMQAQADQAAQRQMLSALSDLEVQFSKKP